ncbi:uncharacterized protein LOC133174020 [Saccostrea echinata]|uniref:uncharacterized protein LOC133174020 n=1 Tax=Saccostrea echinata TaxID=191078 RepID=UPI002A80CDA9|nr:uncharacterized protein LOC133174020 [Saccostrea echinata]
MRHMSESVFVGLCRIVGTSQQVAMRRDIADIREMMSQKISSQSIVILSGSKREGFRLLGSDEDRMTWSENNRVIWDFSQSRHYNLSRVVLILTDSSDSPPGFTLLRLLTPRADKNIRCACVKMNDRLYISSSFYRLIMFTLKYSDYTTHIHGPCRSGNFFGKEYDLADCFVSDFWPPLASSWIDRCHAWPHLRVVRDVVRNGCHFVAIGHKLGNHEDKEWRISFSVAEQKLAYSMNHSQFLTYGLLKVYLKEVINNDVSSEEKLLCSYHMKTAVFWVLQQNLLSNWCPQTFLEGFWICFKIILKWVYEGVCPNFFIPQNNMFLSKIHGEAQLILFLRLYTLYERGIACLLQSPSIRSCVVNALCNPTIFICTNEMTLIPEYTIDAEIFTELIKINLCYTTTLRQSVKALKAVERLMIKSHLTQYHVPYLQRLVALVLRKTAFVLHGMYTNTGSNKRRYIADKLSCHMLKLAVKFNFISDMLFAAMYHCKTLRYKKALSIIELVIAKLTHPQQMFLYFTYIVKDSYLSTVKAQIILSKLQTLVHSDHLIYLPEAYKDISWQILGICQQITGDLQAAFYSYQQSLKQYPLHGIQTATIIRIIILTYRLYFS